mmetsp:Transcript_55457/g.152521  ORF Transcript_55457/g.152521 Transcript_55457/m.152521 type:complete len:346 (-) Transcript_55457:480-1517(-)
MSQMARGHAEDLRGRRRLTRPAACLACGALSSHASLLHVQVDVGLLRVQKLGDGVGRQLAVALPAEDEDDAVGGGGREAEERLGHRRERRPRVRFGRVELAVVDGLRVDVAHRARVPRARRCLARPDLTADDVHVTFERRERLVASRAVHAGAHGPRIGGDVVRDELVLEYSVPAAGHVDDTADLDGRDVTLAAAGHRRHRRPRVALRVERLVRRVGRVGVRVLVAVAAHREQAAARHGEREVAAREREGRGRRPRVGAHVVHVDAREALPRVARSLGGVAAGDVDLAVEARGAEAIARCRHRRLAGVERLEHGIEGPGGRDGLRRAVEPTEQHNLAAAEYGLVI